MERSNIQKLVKEWATKEGKHMVMASLMAKRISPSTAEKLASDRYPKEPRGALLTIIEEELLKAGIIKEPIAG